MFTLVLCYLAGEHYRKDARETVRSAHIPQMGSMISSGNVRHGSYRVVLVGHSVGNGELDSTVYVYLKEVDMEDLL